MLQTLGLSTYCLIPKMIHQRVFYFIPEQIFVLNRHKDTSVSAIEFLVLIKRLCHIIKPYLLL